ncbi:PKD domain-containing protein [Homoserinibacter sp. GY 40078]|uniref:PKD domain-containing protein n=1 Tax=Homoserinibacter sp. GY 40078 TaxID=2603275 RepID=UPI0011C736FD|nr:PKD domain-containing protein [Homoserinibacter sp. GY 40078]TXK17733.1 PKD domain-containing protein [Homoserinibacter sp. GY 40078]
MLANHHSRTPARATAVAIVGVLALSLLSALPALPAPPAAADTAPPAAGIPTTVSSDSLPTPQIDGVVWDQEIVGDTVYVGGNFRTARPAGAAPGTSTVPRAFLLSYRLSTGVLTSWAPVLNGQVDAIDASPDGSRVYVGGAFTTVDGVTRNRIVAFDTATGQAISSFAGSANGEVFAIDSTSSTVYFAGNFSQSNGVSRPGRAAAASAATGATTAWAPVLASGRAYELLVSPDGTRVVIGGSFTSINGSGQPGYGLGAVTSTTGASLPFPVNDIVRNAGTYAAIYSLSGDADSVYGTGYVFGTGGNLEGTFRATWDGQLVWVEDCHGDSYDVVATGGTVYTAGHAHYCGNLGGFPQREPWLNTRAVAFTKAATGTMTRDIYGYYKWTGIASPSVANWFPDFNAGTYTGIFQGPWTITTDGRYVLYGGEFTTVNGSGQQGLSRFAVSSIAPDRDGPRVSGGNWPISAVARGAGTVAITWPANHDRDNAGLTYQVIRNGDTAHPLTQLSAVSTWWDRRGLGYVDTSAPPGTTASYRIRAVDPFGNIADSATVSVAVPTTGALGSYARAVIADGPTWYFRLGETGTSATNWAAPVANVNQSGANAVVQAAVGSAAARGRPGAIVGDSDKSTGFGSTWARAYTTASTWVDDSLTVEAWFRTTASSGKIVGFGTSSSASNSSTADRHLYLDGGRVAWGVDDGSRRVLLSGTGYANGAWHHVAGTLSPTGQKLYVDGVLVAQSASVVKGGRYWGYWHIGGDTAWAGASDLVGDIDEVAIYGDELSAAAIARHRQLGVGGGASNQPPTASFSATASALQASVDGRGSSDSDGTIVAYAWNFGDGSTGSGATSTHNYAAAGTYTITLTVTDDDGATASTTRQLTVAGSPPPPPPTSTIAQDDFARTVTSGWGQATVGGTWTANSASSSSVASGVGIFSHNAGSTRRAVLASTSASRVDLQATVALETAPAGGATVAGVVGRQVGSAFYQARVRFLVGGAMRLEVMNGGATLLGWADLAGTYTAGQRIVVRVEVTGQSPTTIRAKAWPESQAEPSLWQVSLTDATAALQAAGSVGVESYASASATNAPVRVRFDDVRATTVP